MAKTVDYDLKKGDTSKLKKFRILNKGEILALGKNDKLYFTMKKEANKKPVIQKTTENGIVLEDEYYHITLESEDTNELEPISYVYDIELKTASGLVRTLIEGTITLDNDITQKGDEI